MNRNSKKVIFAVVLIGAVSGYYIFLRTRDTKNSTHALSAPQASSTQADALTDISALEAELGAIPELDFKKEFNLIEAEIESALKEPTTQ